MFLDNLFKSNTNNTQLQYANMLSGYTPVFSQFGENIYASDIVQNCIDVIATEMSKLMPRHIRSNNSNLKVQPNSDLNRLFKFAPNPLMTTRDFLEKSTWLLYLNYNAFIYPQYTIQKYKGQDTKTYTAFYPLNPIQVDFLQDSAGKIFVQLYFRNGENYTFAYDEIIHLRKQFSLNDIMGGGYNGQPDNQSLLKVLQVNDVVLQGVAKAVKTSLAIRGIIKMNSMMDNDKLIAERKNFEQKLENNDSGILPIDLKAEYTPLNNNMPTVIDNATQKFLGDKILNHYGVSVPILTGDFTDDQYQAFYTKTLEPLIINYGQAFSKTVFTTNELNFGNEFVFYPQKLLFTNVKNKIAVGDILGNRGALTNNELLDLFGYPPYEGGDERIMSLNFIDSKISNEYQLAKAKVSNSTNVSNTTNNADTQSISD